MTIFKRIKQWFLEDAYAVSDLVIVTKLTNSISITVCYERFMNSPNYFLQLAPNQQLMKHDEAFALVQNLMTESVKL